MTVDNFSCYKAESSSQVFEIYIHLCVCKYFEPRGSISLGNVGATMYYRNCREETQPYRGTVRKREKREESRILSEYTRGWDGGGTVSRERRDVDLPGTGVKVAAEGKLVVPEPAASASSTAAWESRCTLRPRVANFCNSAIGFFVLQSRGGALEYTQDAKLSPSLVLDL